MPTRPRQIPGTGGGANRLNQVRQMAAQRLQQRPPVAGGSGIKPRQGGMPPSITPAPISETIPRFPGLFAGEHSGLPTNAPLLNGNGLPGGTYAPGQMLPGGGNPGINIQAPVINPSGLATTSDGTQIYTDPNTGLQYQNVNGQWAQTSGHLTDPSAGTGTYNGLPQGTSQLLPGQQGYSAPGTPENQVPGYYQADAQGGYISGDWNAYSRYAQSRGVTPFAGPGSTYGGNPVTPTPANSAVAATSPPPTANYDDLKQAILGTQAGQPLNPANPVNSPTGSIQPITSPTVQPAVATPDATPTTLGPTSQQTNPQQFMNQGVPGHVDYNNEHPSGGQNNLGAAVQLAMQRNIGVSKPINPAMPGAAQPKAPSNGMLPFGGLQRLGNFAGAAGRLVGRV